MGKFEEAKSRGSEGSMNYMAREMSDYMKRTEILKSRLLPKKSKKKKTLNNTK